MQARDAANADHGYSFGSVRTENVEEHLIFVAGKAARNALRLHGSSSNSQTLWVAISSGLALESALRAALARKSPVLLGDQKHPGTLIFLADGAIESEMTAMSLRTISATDCLTLVSRLYPGMTSSFDAARHVFDVRNSAAHLGVFERDHVEVALQQMVSWVDEIVVRLDLVRTEFWGHNLLRAVDKMADLRSNAIKARIEVKRANASERFMRLERQFPDGLESVLIALEQRTLGDEGMGARGGRIRQECPVCHRLGLLTVELVSDDVDYTDDGDVIVSRIALPRDFRCNVCNFHVDSTEIFSVSGLPRGIDLDTVTTAANEYFDGWRPE